LYEIRIPSYPLDAFLEVEGDFLQMSSYTQKHEKADENKKRQRQHYLDI
jgi:hypothetical protein